MSSRTDGRGPRAVEPLDLGDALPAAAAAGVPELYARYNLFRAFLHHPELAAAAHQMSDVLTFRSGLAPSLRELAILRVGEVMHCGYLLHQHREIALEAGVRREQVDAVLGWQASSAFDDVERAVLLLTDEALLRDTVPEPVLMLCRRELGDGPASLVALLAVVGWWRSIALFLNATSIAIEGADDDVRA